MTWEASHHVREIRALDQVKDKSINSCGKENLLNQAVLKLKSKVVQKTLFNPKLRKSLGICA